MRARSCTKLPPLLQVLMKSAPRRRTRRTARRQSSAPLARMGPPKPGISVHSSGTNDMSSAPPVGSMKGPAQRTRGPGMLPSAMASRMASAVRPPASRTVVKPDSRSARASATARAVISPGPVNTSVRMSIVRRPDRWTWQSIRPGRRNRPSRSTTAAPRGIVEADSAPTFAM